MEENKSQQANQASASSRTYVVKAGDTLSSISKAFYGDPNEYLRIFNANRHILEHPDRIREGQELLIP